MFIGLMLLGKAGDDYFENDTFYGFTLMFLAFSLAFMGTRITREKYNGGYFSFVKVFRVGFYISWLRQPFMESYG